MKFQVDIDLDWVEEDGTIDEAIKYQIISRVEEKVTSQLVKKIMESATERIEEQINNICSDAIKARVDDLMTGKRVLTDSFGAVVNPDFSIEKALTDLIAGALTRKTLDENGRHSDGYNKKYTQFEWHTVREVPSMVNKAVEVQLKDTESTIKRLVEEKIKSGIADKLTNLIVNNSASLSLKP